jgi:hypothetical protein
MRAVQASLAGGLLQTVVGATRSRLGFRISDADGEELR